MARAIVRKPTFGTTNLPAEDRLKRMNFEEVNTVINGLVSPVEDRRTSIDKVHDVPRSPFFMDLKFRRRTKG